MPKPGRRIFVSILESGALRGLGRRILPDRQRQARRERGHLADRDGRFGGSDASCGFGAISD